MEHSIEIKIFIVEDDPVFTQMLSDIVTDISDKFALKGITINYETFYSSKESSFELRKSPDIVLLDYYILDDELEPDTALQVLRKIRQYNKDIDVIVVSGQNDENVSEGLLKLGAQEYLGKGSEDLIRLEYILEKMINKRIQAKNKKK